MKLNEMNSITNSPELKAAQTPREEQEVIVKFCVENNVGGGNEDILKKFVSTNYLSLIKEIEAYGLSTDNPFFTFLTKYAKQNGSIDTFLNESNYSLLHNTIPNYILNTKQIAFTCPETQQARILLNPSLWNIAEKNDIWWLLKTYVWFSEETVIDDFIINSFVIKAFFDESESNHSFKSFEMRKQLLRVLYFTTYINDLFELRNKEKGEQEAGIDEIRAKIQNVPDNYFISYPLEPVDVIEHQVNILNELTQESPRNENGKFQQVDATPGNENKSDLSAQDKRIILSKAQNIISNAGQQLGTQNTADIKQALAFIGNQ